MANWQFKKTQPKFETLYSNSNWKNNLFSSELFEEFEYSNFSTLNALVKKIENPKNNLLFFGDVYFLVDLDEENTEISCILAILKRKSDNKIFVEFKINSSFVSYSWDEFIVKKSLQLAKEKHNTESVFYLNNSDSKSDFFSDLMILESKENDAFLCLSTDYKESDLIDLHAHPLKGYYENPTEEIQNNFKNGISKMLFVGTSWDENTEIMQEFKKHKNVFPVLGVHPNDVNDKEDYTELRNFITEDVYAIGEIGLDFHYDDNASKETQIKALREQIQVAQEFNLPVILHIREGLAEFYELLKEEQYRKTTFIFHTYSGDREWTHKFLKFENVYFSFSGVITYKKNFESRKVVEMIPLERIFSETDAPYLAPEPFRSQTNHSDYVKYTVETIALIKKISISKLKQIIEQNFQKVFKK
ncbi:TatD family hydrolase [Mycoplasma procyoni]|uniref:TatD family hydrolase n=1 Tax=Mycoplasma procyoni TaxID=568784 RepID=UPI00197B097F|nr:TatD family hydrolase [Mycoplasma procyoni]MBN3535086.1 TatD family hydrolase [Mycoplasma procyoni]